MRLILMAAFVAVFFVATPAAAQRVLNLPMVCMPTDALEGGLAKRYQESQRALGLDSRKALIRLFTPDDGSTFTMVLTFPNGMSCILAAGKMWADRPQPRELPGVGT